MIVSCRLEFPGGVRSHYYTPEHYGASNHRRNRGNLCNSGNQGANERRADRLTKDKEVDDVCRHILERPVHPRVSKQHWTERKSAENRKLSSRHRIKRYSA